MVRITRRDFLKYCSIAAGALGLSASTLMKIENVMAANANVDVVWISGAACTGCTMSLLNSVFYTTVDDLLFNRIDLKYLDTVMATAGAYVNGVQWEGANALKAAQDVYNNSAGFVLVVEGAIPTGTPAGGGATAGDFCRIGDLTGDGTHTDTVLDNVEKFAAKATCLAVLCVGTCSSFGGIPGARGNVTGSKGVAFSGTSKGGAIVQNTATGKITGIIVTDDGTGCTSPSFAVTIGAVDDGGGASAAATAYTDVGTVTSIALPGTNGGYTTIPLVEIAAPTLGSLDDKQAYATAVISTGGLIERFIITNPGYGYSGNPVVTITNAVTGTERTAAASVGAGAVTRVVVTNAGSGYTSAPDVTFSQGAGSVKAYAAVATSKGDVTARTNTAAKVINISGCPPHPDWIVGTIAHILDTAVTLPSVNANYQPVDYGYGAYQCNAGPCQWRYNNATSRDDHNARYPIGESRDLGKFKWGQIGANGKGTPGDYAQGCLGILGCKGRKTKADCSRRRWNGDAAETYGVNWCVGSRGGCHGCTEPAFPDKVGKFFTFA